MSNKSGRTRAALRTRTALRVAGFAVAAIACAGSAVSGQDQPTAALAGLVFDSTAMTPLVGARVAVMGTSALGTTDESGRFLLRDVPEGAVLGFVLPSAPAGAGRQRTSSPGESERWGHSERHPRGAVRGDAAGMGWCMAEQPAPGSAAIAGFVTDSVTGVPMPRAIVRAEPISRMPGLRAVEVRTDDSGVLPVVLRPRRHGHQAPG